MRCVLTADEMKYYDNYTIEKTGIPSLLLMERAAMEMTAVIESRMNYDDRIIVFAGTGNNGGDALAAGRILCQKGVKVTFYMPGDLQKMSRETEKQVEILQNLGFSIYGNLPEGEYDIIVDGLFGIGLKREVSGVYKRAVSEMMRLKGQGAWIAAVDIASGICADTGRVMGCAVAADLTVTFAYAKAGHYFYPGREYTGELFIREIGITKKATEEKRPSYMTVDQESLTEMLPKRTGSGNKGTFGKVLLFAGSKDMCGAAVLCGKGVFSAGAGMVKIITPAENREILQKILPEAMLYTYTDGPEEEAVAEALSWADVIVAGPGIGKSEEAVRIMQMILKQGKKPLVIDADGLNLIAQEEKIQRAVLAYEAGRIIMTPHPGEFVRLSGISMEDYKKNPKAAIKELARRYCCVIVGKDAVTLVGSYEDEMLFMNHLGNDGMAVAGSGDVLAGTIGGFLAQGMEAFAAACLGVQIHAAAGDKAAERKSRYGMMASDILDGLYDVLNEAEERGTDK